MQKTLEVASKDPTYGELLQFAEGTTSDVLRRSANIIDALFTDGYAMKNPALVSSVARIMFDEFCVMRAHHGARKALQK